MKSFSFIALLALSLFVVCAHADCGEESKSGEGGEVTQFFKNIGCKIQKGAEDLQETAKPWADKISSSAKDFGNTVAQKYDELKHKLTDEQSGAAASSTPFPVANGPTEKVPLAPLSGGGSGGDGAAPAVVSPGADVNAAGVVKDA